jgi:bifunctional pyridoxal-dependent enzyme with beta-cystathionase and maltose regulon repressor activities
VGLRRRPLWRGRSAALHHLGYGFRHRPCITDALHQRINHGVFGYSRWKNDEFLAAVAHWFQQRFNSHIDTETVVYGPSVIYMVSELIRLWSTPATAWWFTPRHTMRFTKPLKAMASCGAG